MKEEKIHWKTFQNWLIIFPRQRFVLGRLEAFPPSSYRTTDVLLPYDRSSRASYTTADHGMFVVGSSPSQPTLLYVCVLLVECLTTLGQSDLLCGTAVLPAVPVRVCVPIDLRFFSSCCCCMSDTINSTRTAFQKNYTK